MQVVEGASAPMAKLVERFLVDHTARRGIGPATVRNYRRRLLQILPELWGEELNPAGFHALADREGWNDATRASYWASVRNFTRWAFREGELAEDPFEDMAPPRKPRLLPNPLSDGEAALVLRIADEQVAGPRGDLHPVDEWARIALYAGLRTMEIAKLDRSDLRSGILGPELVVQGKGGTHASIPAHPEIVNIMEAHGPGPLYPGVTPGQVQSAGKGLFRKAGLPGGFHRFRHTFATRLYREHKDPFLVKDLCRHESIESTLGYAKLADSRRHSAISAL